MFDLAGIDFRRQCIGGLASGEGLVADVARRGEGLGRSVLVVEPEFARLLRVAGNSATLSAIIRECWDGDRLAVMTRRQPLRADGANVAILGHVTEEELRRRLSDVEIANGFANRFLFTWVERSKRLPNGGQVPADELDWLGVRVGVAVLQARELGTLTRSPAADSLWARIYNSIDDDVEGVVGALTARAEAQLLRLSVVYTLLDASPTIEVVHLQAAQAVWEHCEDTIGRVFAGQVPDGVAARLLAALEAAGPEGLTGTQQRDVFSCHVPGDRLAAARMDLEDRGLAYTTTVDTGGRRRVVTRAVPTADTSETSEVQNVPGVSLLRCRVTRHRPALPPAPQPRQRSIPAATGQASVLTPPVLTVRIY